MTAVRNRSRAVAALLLPLAMAVAAERLPADRPVRLVVPFTPGGNADVVARTMAQAMSDTLRQAVVVENRPGATP